MAALTPECSACGGLIAPHRSGLWTCPACGSARVWPPRDERSRPSVYTADYFDTCGDARGYFDSQRMRAWKRRSAQVLLWRTRRHLAMSAQAGRVLDFGAGAGDLGAAWQVAGLPVVALEPNPVGQALCREQGLQVVAGLNELAPSERFQAILMCDVLEHLLEPLDCLRALLDRLAPQGGLVITTPDFGGPYRRVLGPRWPHLKPNEHLHYFTRAGLRLLAGRADCATVQVAANVKVIGLDYLLRDQGRRGGRIGQVADRLGQALRWAVPFPVVAYLDEMVAVLRR